MERLAGIIVAATYLFANVIGAHAAESSLWAERRRRVSEQKATGSSTQMFACLQNTPIQPLPVSSVKLAQSLLPVGFAGTHKNLFEALSPALGTVRHVWFPAQNTNKSPLILHIQDVHMNQDAQRNIARVVESLINKGIATTVALEGAWGPIHIKPFQDYENRQAVKRTADYLLKGNEISGPIYSGMLGKGMFVGIDDKNLFTANVEAYTRSIPLIASVKVDLERQIQWVKQKKAAVFSPELHRLDRVVERYRQGITNLGEYVQILTMGNRPSPELQKFLKALKYEHTTDFRKVEEDRAVLIDKLVQRLSKTQINELTAHAVSHRSGRMGFGNFYAYLQSLCKSSGVRLEEFPALGDYIKYTLLADAINVEVLLNDVNDLETKAYTALTKTVEQAKLVQESRQLYLTEKLVDFSLTPTEWKEYQRNPKENLKTFESFYQEADARDAAMSVNVLKETAGAVTILVTGGFHGEGMTKKLTEAGATVIRFVPKIEKVDVASGSSYLSVFTQAKTPLEKLMQGEKLFLAQNPAKGLLTTGPLGVISEDLVSEGTRPLQKLNVADETKQKIRKFLKETTGQDLTVEFEEIVMGDNRTEVTLPIKIGERKFHVEVTLNKNAEITSIEKINSENPLAPSRMADVALRWIVRLHGMVDRIQKTMTGPPAARASRWTKRIAGFTEALLLAGVPQWRGAHYAWFLSYHDVTSVENLVWRLAGLQSIGFVQKRAQETAISERILRWFQDLRSQMKTHSHFQNASPFPLAVSGWRTNPDEFRLAVQECVVDSQKLPIPIGDYPQRYQEHAVYFLVRDMQQGGLIGGVGVQNAHKVINGVLGKDLFKVVGLHPSLFWEGAKMIGESPVQYTGVEGMVRLAGNLFRKFGSANLGQMFDAFGRDRGVSAAQLLTGKDIRSQLQGANDLGWEKIDMGYEKLSQLATEISNEPRSYTGIEGMIRLATIHRTHLRSIYRAFGRDRGMKVVKELTGADIQTMSDGVKDLDWPAMDLSYQRLLELATEIADTPERYRGVRGMIRLARIHKTNLGQINSVFGGARGVHVVEILTGVNIRPLLPEGATNLGWERISLPYEALASIAQEIAKDVPKYVGVEGMIRLAGINKTNLGNLFSAFGSDRGLEVIEEMTGLDIRPRLMGEAMNLGWEPINLPYDQLAILAKEISTNPERYVGVEGWSGWREFTG